MGKSSRTKNATTRRSGRDPSIAAPAPGRPLQRVPARRARRPQTRSHFSGWWLFVGVAIVVVGAIVALVAVGNSRQQAGRGATYQVGTPGPGADAPPIRLNATDGSQFDLTAYRGKTVLGFFQEGLGCERCWTQLKDINSSWAQFRAAGIDQVITVTGNPVAALKEKVAIEGVTTPVLADPGLRVSQTHNANQYGMMGTSTDGHTFIVVGPDGKTRWRADYGGAPDYTMYVAIPNLLADISQGMKTGF